MLTKECCPQCDREADSSRLRLVQDSCGHKKCRECLLSDEVGCLLCSFPPEPEYTELRPVAGLIQDALLSVDQNVPEDVDTEPVAAENSAVTRNEIPSTSVESDAVEKLPLSSSFSTDQKVVEEESDTVGDPTVIPEVPDKVVDKKSPTFGLKDHIIFTPGDPPSYFCKKCKKTCNNRKAARYHNYCGASDKEKPHNCGECGQGFVSTSHLAYHIKSHTGSLPFTCKSCGKGFKQSSKLKRHLKSHEGAHEKPFMCDLCEKTFTSRQNLKDHILLHSKDHFVPCPICNKKLSSQSCLRKHKKLHADLVHKCKDCGKKFPVKWTLDVHMKTHQRERKFKCKTCNKAFKIHGDLKRHALVHQEDGEWECKVCLLIFRRRDNLVRHLKNIHPESPLIVSTKQMSEQDADGNEDEPEEIMKSSSSSVSAANAVSVIRGPVIQRVEALSVDSDQLENRGSASSSDSQNNGWTADINQGGQSSSLMDMDQNRHRESVVCHSDARGVVHHGSSTMETVYESRLKVAESFIEEVPSNCDNFQVYDFEPGIAISEHNLLQSSSVQRPRVIVAKEENCL